MSYKPNYTDGWKSGVSGGTPITPEALNHMESGIETANEHLLPEPQTADNATFLRNDDTWQKVTPANIGAAPSAHRHNASDISEGTVSSDRLPTVPISKGGTGATDAATARTNLGIAPSTIGAAPSSHRHDASDISAGLLGIARGGTGAANKLDAKKNLELEGLQTMIITNSSAKGILQTLKDDYGSLADYQLYIIRIADAGAQRIAIGMKYGNYAQFIGISIEGFRYYNNYNGTWSERVIS
jgi:hypothetical protein